MQCCARVLDAPTRPIKSAPRRPTRIPGLSAGLGSNPNRAANDQVAGIPQKENQIETTNSVVAVFADHPGAEAAVKKLSAAGFEMKNLSVVGNGYHSEEKIIGDSPGIHDR